MLPTTPSRLRRRIRAFGRGILDRNLMALDRGVRLGPYEIVEVLGAGGMGEVYRARDPRLGRDLAIKVLAPSLAQDAAALARFEREARTASSLNHPNIVHIYEIGEATLPSGRIHYIAMEYIEGQTLRARLRAGERWKSLLEPLTSVAEALAKAHKAGVVHRDLKPENVMITGDGYPKVVDFGLAKLFEGARAPVDAITAAEPDLRTGTGTLLGTPSYMSPEQAQGKPADHRSDIFSFGCILYEATTGRRTFAADSAVATLHAIVYDAPSPVESLSADAPLLLHRIVNTCLAKDPAQRYQSTGELVSDLRVLSRPSATPNTETAPTMALSESTRPSGSGGSARRWLALGAVVAVAFVGAAVWRGRSVAVPSGSPDAGLLQIEKITNRGNVSDVALSNDGRYLAYVASGPAQSIWLRDILEKTETRLVAPFESARSSKLWFASGGHSIYYDFTPKGSTGSSIYEAPLIGGAPRLVVARAGRLSPDGRRFAEMRRHGGKETLFISDLETGQKRDLGEIDRWWIYDWSPDGSLLPFAQVKEGKDVLFIAKMDGTGVRQIAELTSFNGFWWKPKSDGALIGSEVADQGRVRLLDLDLGTGSTHPVGDRVWQDIVVRWLPDGTGLVIKERIRGRPAVLWLVSYPDGRATRIPASEQAYGGLSLSADGSTLASVQSVRLSDILVSSDPDRGAFKPVEKGTDVNYRGRWLTDGKIVFHSNDAGTYDLYVADPDGSNRAQLTFDRAGNETSPAPSPDGRYIVFESDRSGRRRLYRINRDGTDLMPLTPQPNADGYDAAPTVTPDSRWVLYRHWDHGPALWKISIDGGPPTVVRGEPQNGSGPGATGRLLESVYGGSASPDGRLLAYFYAYIYSTKDVKRLSALEMVVASSDGTIVTRFPYNDGPFTVSDNWRIQWSPDGRYLYYNGGRAGDSLWKQALAGGPPVQITHFDQPLSYFDWSRDGKKLLVSRSSTLSDAVLITHFR